MESKQKAKELLPRSVFLSPQKKDLLLAAVGTMKDAETQDLIRILETEVGATRTVLEKNFSPDSSVKTLRDLDELLRANTKEVMDEVVKREAVEGEANINTALSEMS